MNKLIIIALIIGIIISCTQSQTAQAPLLNLKDIAGHTAADVASKLGNPTDTEQIKIDGTTCPKLSYKDGAVEIVYINSKADWITVTLNNGAFDKTALGILSLPVADPTKSNQNVLRWENYESTLSISLFPKPDGTINYFYIKTATP